MRFKLPWVDATACKLGCDCPTAIACREGAFLPLPGQGDEKRAGTSATVDFERYEQCGDCPHACPEGAVRMV